MTANPNDESLMRTERRVLQALCQGMPQGSVRELGKLILKDYRWREPLHQVVFNVLIDMPTDVPDVIHNQLPARLTRKGFPDVATEDLFQPHSLSKAEAERLMKLLRDSI